MDVSCFNNMSNGINTLDEQESSLIQSCELFASVIADDFYILDIPNKSFCFIKSDGLFFCGHPTTEVLELGYDFYSCIIHPEDLPSWNSFLDAIPRYLRLRQEEINRLMCVFRITLNNPFSKRILYQIVSHQIVPVWKNNEVHYLICIVKNSMCKKTGFYLYYNNSSIYEEYSPKKKSWFMCSTMLLTEREKFILELAKKGLNVTEIADVLCRSKYTIQNQIKSLFSKLEVHSIQEALEQFHFLCSH